MTRAHFRCSKPVLCRSEKTNKVTELGTDLRPVRFIFKMGSVVTEMSRLVPDVTKISSARLHNLQTSTQHQSTSFLPPVYHDYKLISLTISRKLMTSAGFRSGIVTNYQEQRGIQCTVFFRGKAVNISTGRGVFTEGLWPPDLVPDWLRNNTDRRRAVLSDSLCCCGSCKVSLTTRP